MNEGLDLVQSGIAALWESTRSLRATENPGLAGLVEGLAEVEAQIVGLRLHLIHEARLAGADDVLAGVRESVRTTTAQATSAMKLSAELGERFELVADALNNGRVSLAQAEAIVSGLKKLPAHLTRTELGECQKSILEHADTLGPTELRTLAARLLEVIDPERADAEEAKRLAAEERAAHRNRYLHLSPDHHGSMRITGQLPVAEAALLAAQLDALMPSASSYAHSGEIPSRDMRRADALVLLCEAAAATGTLPAHGGDRPTVHVTIDYDTLVTGLGAAGIFGLDGVTPISAGDARRLACDAKIIPVVLDGNSRPLDVGGEKRFFTPAMLTALTERDQGCAFPHCNTAPASCHAHHITPWWAGGPTSIDNGVLLCPHHHRVVEPDPKQSPDSQWRVHLDPATGLPTFTPPRHIDPAQQPRQHARYLLRGIKLDPPPQAPPCPKTSRTIEIDLDELRKHASPAWKQHAS